MKHLQLLMKSIYKPSSIPAFPHSMQTMKILITLPFSLVHMIQLNSPCLFSSVKFIHIYLLSIFNFVHYTRDNIFIFHLADKCFWQLPTDSKVQHCSAIRFVPHNKSNLLLGNKSGFIYEIEISEYRKECISFTCFPPIYPVILLLKALNGWSLFSHNTESTEWKKKRKHEEIELREQKRVRNDSSSVRIMAWQW